MSAKSIVTLVGCVVFIVIGCFMFSGCIGRNDFQTYQIKQGITGDVDIIDAPGIYNKAFATIYTYPRSVQAFYSKHPQEGGQDDTSVRVHFNDGGTAGISVMIQFALPTDADKRKHLHQIFGNVNNAQQAVRAHLINCIKNTGPMMSATENQAARKGEFNQVVEEQLRKGIYAMRRVEVELKDLNQSTIEVPGATAPRPNRVMATEIVLDPKTQTPVIVEKSPLEDYGILIQQFSITGIDYDEATNQQFVTKQKSFLMSEGSKAERERELNQTAMVIQQGLRQKAEIEATENVKKAQQVIQAEALAEVALQTKKAAETVAEQKLSVAKLEKEAAETKAQQEAAIAQIAADQSLKVATVSAQEAEQKAKAVISLAEAEQKKIALAGALSEKDKMTLEFDSKTKIGVAEALSKVNVPSTVINGGGANGGNSTENLFQAVLLKNLGFLTTEKPRNPETVGK